MLCRAAGQFPTRVATALTFPVFLSVRLSAVGIVQHWTHATRNDGCAVIFASLAV